jgi:hypothetical protein
MKRGMEIRPSDPIERQLIDIFGKKRLLSAELKTLVRQVCLEAHVSFEGPRSLGMATKSEVLDWITTRWDDLSGPFRVIAANRVQGTKDQ